MARTIDATVAGRVLKHLVSAGETVAIDAEVALIESMKMHIPVVAESEGRLVRWLVQEGAEVKEGQPLATLE